MGRLWEHEVHKDHLKREPDTVADVEFPARICDTDRVDE